MPLEISDKQAISDLLSRSAFALDHKDLTTLEAGFTEDACFTLVIEGTGEPAVFEGREAILGLMKGALDAQTDVRRHGVSNIWYQHEDDDSATVVSYLTLSATENGEITLITTGIYTDQVIRDGTGGWLIKDRHLHLDRPY